MQTFCAKFVRISIHALRVEGDLPPGRKSSATRKRFLSTPSGWRVTRESYGGAWLSGFLSTPSGWRVTLRCCVGAFLMPISIHALRVEGDLATERE